jgi:hypothetical protein
MSVSAITAAATRANRALAPARVRRHDGILTLAGTGHDGLLTLASYIRPHQAFGTSLSEITRTFTLLDSHRDGRLALAELQAAARHPAPATYYPASSTTLPAAAHQCTRPSPDTQAPAADDQAGSKPSWARRRRRWRPRGDDRARSQAWRTPPVTPQDANMHRPPDRSRPLLPR